MNNACERPIIIDEGPFLECTAENITLLLLLLAELCIQTSWNKKKNIANTMEAEKQY